MIRVAKPGQAPRILRERGQRTAEADRQAFEGGERTFKFDSSIYGAKSVKSALINAQHDKCAFCESKVSHIAHGDVEHYRPKGGAFGRTLQMPWTSRVISGSPTSGRTCSSPASSAIRASRRTCSHSPTLRGARAAIWTTSPPKSRCSFIQRTKIQVHSSGFGRRSRFRSTTTHARVRQSRWLA
jgi:hypothetical protein